jgi:aryl-alcohol dehydrogenase-like predicted oxidoreductase
MSKITSQQISGGASRPTAGSRRPIAPRRVLGKTGIIVSEVAFGGVEIGLPYGIGVTSEADMLSEEQAIQLLHASLDSGINFFDTARMYGNSEAIMGKAFVGRRSEVVLATKCRHFRDAAGKLSSDAELEGFIHTSLAESLQALQTDYVDVFMLHQADLEILDNPEIARVFLELKSQGKIRATGASSYSVEETRKAIESGAWDVIQLPFNLLDQRQSSVFELAQRNGVALVVRSVLMKGLLSDRGKNLHPELKDVENHIAGYAQWAQETYGDLPTMATKFALSFPEVSAVLIGMDKMEYLQKSLEIADGNYMNPKELEIAQKQAYPDPAFLNLPHWHKMGWLT